MSEIVFLFIRVGFSSSREYQFGTNTSSSWTEYDENNSGNNSEEFRSNLPDG